MICFITWAYLGDYQTEAVGVSSQTLAVVEHSRRRKLSKKEQKMEDRRLMQRRGSLFYHSEEIQTEPEVSKDYNNEDSTPNTESTSTVQVLLSQTVECQLHHLLLNTQIYVFANIYLIEDLKAVAQQKIVNYLEKSNGGNLNSAQPMFDMLEYASTHLPEDDQLLDWLAKYVGSRLGLFRRDKEKWNAVIGRDEGKLAKLVMEYVSSGPSEDASHCPNCGAEMSRYY